MLRHFATVRQMRRAFVIAAVLLATSCAASTEVGGLPPGDTALGVEPTALVPVPPARPAEPAATTRCRDDGSYRARLVETDAATGDVLTEQRYEVTSAHLRAEPAGGENGIVVLQGSEAWRFDSGGWQELTTVPVRPLRTPWVNNFVTGPAVAQAASGAVTTPDSLHGFDGRRIELTYDQFSGAFPQKVDGSDYVPTGSSFVYWLDPCDQILRAEITTTFGPETAELMGPDFPLVLDYLYESYDIGGDFAVPDPGEPITPIPPPSA